MSDFLSINPAPETVTINGKKTPVHGISMTGFGSLIPRFPNLVNELNERMKKDGNLTMPAIFDVVGPAIGPILAAGLGYPGNEEAEQKAAQLDATTQLKVLDKIVEKTMPDGLGPFVEAWGQNAYGTFRATGTTQDALQGFAEGIESLIGVCGHTPQVTSVH